MKRGKIKFEIRPEPCLGFAIASSSFSALIWRRKKGNAKKPFDDRKTLETLIDVIENEL